MLLPDTEVTEGRAEVHGGPIMLRATVAGHTLLLTGAMWLLQGGGQASAIQQQHKQDPQRAGMFCCGCCRCTPMAVDRSLLLVAAAFCSTPYDGV
jgi:hypothetical protein